MKFKRAGGVILHPTSFSGPDGIGDLGPEAYQWVEMLARTGSTLWQVLPLGPTGYGDSPYQSFSAFAGNPYLVSTTMLLDEGLLRREDLADRPDFPADVVDYGPVIEWKIKLLDRASCHYQDRPKSNLKQEFQKFQNDQANWLEDFALFMAIKESESGASWNYWPKPLRKRDPEALGEFKKGHEKSILDHTFRQFLFFRQWSQLRKYANQKGVRIIGDAPIFVAYDSADVWAHPELFYLDEDENPTVVAGVPPDYFSPTGQLWGNPLYRWDVHHDTGYAWWIERLRSCLNLFDYIRLDHFRGFVGYWEVPAGMLTAEIGEWKAGPGERFFDAIAREYPDMPIIAEDLGEITQDVIDLRVRYHLLGMKILQFAFSTDPDDPFLPHNYPANCVAYTGTHDNDTSLGWYQTAPESERDLCRRYLARSGDDLSWDFIRAVWGSVAIISMAPMQDLLSLESEARMNFPGRPSGNWRWRMPANAFNESVANRLKEMNFLYGRIPDSMKERKPKKLK
ncbi:MAG TPA: 4-alpha-glucanotransferase [Anaerolineaceae bacterium]|nr:4-alpha-glucanotransferase [Anaerolineaceae bacterium]